MKTYNKPNVIEYEENSFYDPPLDINATLEAKNELRKFMGMEHTETLEEFLKRIK